jgi:organic hydroperoxide reductase OsmC/OhrA
MEAYKSRATATMEKTTEGLRITDILIEVAVRLKDTGQEAALRKAVEMADKSCPISAALNCPVTVELSVSHQD